MALDVLPTRSVFAVGDLERVITTDNLNRRTPRAARPIAERNGLRRLSQTLREQPESILQTLCDVALDVCDADTAGMSILERHDSEAIFRWRALAGIYAPHLGGMTPRDFSPCGTTMDRGTPQLFSRLDRHFTYFQAVKPAVVEALLVPFYVGEKPAGTMWVVAHDDRRRFDREDARVLTTMASFAGAAYGLLLSLKNDAGQSEARFGRACNATDAEHPLHNQLSQREIEVMSMIVRGAPQKEIAFKLNISVKTVATHRTRLLQKLKVNGSFELLRYALDHGLVNWSEVR
jgi:DNA-binding CsgD family transcriptional regulator